MRLRVFVVLSVLLVCLGGGVSLAEPVSTIAGVPILAGKWQGKDIEYLKGEILVGLKPQATQKEFGSQLGKLNVRIVREADRFGFLILNATDTETFFDLIKQVAQLTAVAYAEPNQVHRVFVTPNDPLFVQQWSLNNTGQIPPGGTVDSDIDAVEGWNFTTGSNQVMVGVLDTGIPIVGTALSHPDLDDTARFVLGINTVGGSLPRDGNGHGTHVTGTIAAETNNGVGVAGVAWNCRVMAIKVFNDNGSGTDVAFRDGVIYAVDHGCRVLNYSGGGYSGSTTMQAAIAYADSHEVVICVSAGNNYQSTVSYPGAYSTTFHNVVCVSATDQNDQSSPYSSIGPEVTVSAPGGYGRPFDADDIYSTFPNYTVQLNTSEGLPLNYAYLAGTSMACPHVTGLAALVLSAMPTLSADSVRSLLVSSADDLGPAGWDSQFGAGRINAYRALLSLGNVNIGHNPLTDTKNYTTSYRVDCSIYSQYPVIGDSVLLKYRLNSTPTWTIVHMTPGKSTDPYHGFIPAQSPGTYINYMLSARNTNGDRDTTAVYTFKVIDYQLILEPAAQLDSALVGVSVWNDISVTNDGVYADNFLLTRSGNVWNTTIWDNTHTNQITSTPTLNPDQRYTFGLKVVVPSSLYEVWDSVAVKATSAHASSQWKQVYCRTMSLGQPLTWPFTESFTSTTFNRATWIRNPGATIDNQGINPPSAPYAARLNGDPSGEDTLISQVVLLTQPYVANLDYFYEQTGHGEPPDEGDNLYIEFLDSTGEWQLLKQHNGADPDMFSFSEVSLALPPAAYHPNFRFRFRTNSTSGARDDWFIDNVSITHAPQATISTSGLLTVTLPPDSSARALIVLQNAGTGSLSFEVDVEPDYGAKKLFDSLAASGKVEPASHQYSADVMKRAPVKGTQEPSGGPAVKSTAGGPDGFGYRWLSSDEAGGPTFAWVDIATTGAEVTGLTDDSYAGPFPIGFPFTFYGNTYTEFYVSSNGFVGFGPPAAYGTIANEPIPNVDVPGNFVALLWDDLNILDPINPGASIKYQTIGDRLVVQYINFPEFGAGSGDIFNGEIALCADGSMKLQYLSFGSGFDKAHCTVGIEDQDGFDGLQVVYAASFLHDNLSVIISTMQTPWLTVSPGSGWIASGQRDTVTVAFDSRGLLPQMLAATITINNNDPHPGSNPWTALATMTVAFPYLVGDANGDRLIAVSDAVYLLNYIFSGGNAPDPLESGDSNCDQIINVTDVVYLLNYIFGNGPAPCQASR